MPRRLDVALVWHMHQPWYRDDVAGEFVLPWVRRRAAKDYLHMLQVLERHPDVRVTINMVPALLEQLEIYGAGDFRDADRELCLRDAGKLTAAERDFLIAGARHNDYGRRVAALAPFVQLCNGLPHDGRELDVAGLRDLQVWTMLAWIDPDQVRVDAKLDALVRRGRGFSEADKTLVDDRQLGLLRQVIPRFRDAVSAGRVEPMTSPYHHPILPLLLDPASARVAAPGVALPEPPLRAESDATEHVRRGLASFARITGAEAAGMWPPECAVSPATAALLAAMGVRFAVSDEGVLARTLRGDVREDGALYAPHRGREGLTLVFRDAQLSNRIGFSYQSMSAEAAAADLVRRLEEIAARSPDDAAPRLLTIALDGENFKDFYEENATPFLDSFYAGLVASPRLRSTHIGAFLDAHPDVVRELPPLWTGSWIDADLCTWIGGDTHDRAWNLLSRTRQAIAASGGAAAHPRAHDEVLIAESSDWFWWFGEHHDSGSDAAWDALFRTHLRNALTLAGLDVPTEVDQPIHRDLPLGHDCAPLRAIDPAGAGEREWASAGVVQVGAVFGAMRPPESSVSRVLFGLGVGHLHLRFGDAPPRFDRCVIDAGALGRLLLDRPTRTLSVVVPRNAALDLSITLDEAGRGIERVPAVGTLHLAAPHGAERPARVVIVAAECRPLAAVGDLAADVAAVASVAAALGHDVVVVIPRHRDASPGDAPGVRLDSLAATVEGRTIRARVLQGALPGVGVPVLSIDAPAYFDRDAVYGAVDDGDRYLAFCALARSLLDATGFAPDIVHGFEWQAGALLAALAASPQPPATVLSAAPASPGYRLDAARLAAAGVGGAGVGEVDLLDVARAAVTTVEPARHAGGLAGLYGTALDRRGRR